MLRRSVFVCFPLSVVYWRHCVLSGRTQRRALPWHLERRNRNINLSKYFISSIGSKPQLVGFTVTLCTPAPRLTRTACIYNIKFNSNFYPMWRESIKDKTKKLSNTFLKFLKRFRTDKIEAKFWTLYFIYWIFPMK